jgi:hypothetical protein
VSERGLPSEVQDSVGPSSDCKLGAARGGHFGQELPVYVSGETLRAKCRSMFRDACKNYPRLSADRQATGRQATGRPAQQARQNELGDKRRGPVERDPFFVIFVTFFFDFGYLLLSTGNSS